MKKKLSLKDLGKKEIYETIMGGGKKIKVLFTSMTMPDKSERDSYYEEIKKKVLENVKEFSKKLKPKIDEMTRPDLEKSLADYYGVRIDGEVDLVDIENQNVLEKDEIKHKQSVESKKIKEDTVKRIKEKSDNDLRFEYIMIFLRMKYADEFLGEILKPTLCVATKDPITGERLLSMNRENNGLTYIEDLDPDVYKQMVEKSRLVWERYSEENVRRLTDDPDFLLLSTYVGNVM